MKTDNIFYDFHKRIEFHSNLRCLNLSLEHLAHSEILIISHSVYSLPNSSSFRILIEFGLFMVSK